MRLGLPEWRPDASDLNAEHTRHLRNVIPQSDGYGPFRGLEAFTKALPGVCRGAFAARRTTGAVAIFAATSTRLYLLNNTSLDWDDVSKDASDYGAIDPGANWTFAQFGNLVIACQKNEAPQVYNLASSAEFDDLAGSPPQAGYVTVVGPFVVLSDLLSDPYRVQWSAINDATGWTSGTNRSDYQDLPDGGRPLAVVEMSSDVALILQEEGARRMVYQPGSAVIFRIDRLPDAPGILSPYSAVVTLGGCYYFASTGFVRVQSDGQVTRIGEERVNRTVLGQHAASVRPDILDLAWDDAYPNLVNGVVSPRRSIILFTYKSDNSSVEVFDRGLLYHTSLDRWAPVELSGEILLRSAQPGVTLEGLDYIAPGALPITGAADNGSGLIRITVSSTSSLTTGDIRTITDVGGTTEANGTWTITVVNGTTFDLQGSTFANTYTSGGVVAGSVDEMTVSFDDYSIATLPSIAAFDGTHALGFFSGDALEAEVETAEQSLTGRRLVINGVWPDTDADTVYGSVVTRDTRHATVVTEGSENVMNDDGFIALLDEGRYVRGRLRIPAGTAWTYVRAMEPDFTQGGRL